MNDFVSISAYGYVKKTGRLLVFLSFCFHCTWQRDSNSIPRVRRQRRFSNRDNSAHVCVKAVTKQLATASAEVPPRCPPLCQRTGVIRYVGAVQQWCADHGENFSAPRRDFLKEHLIRTGNAECNKKTGALRFTLAKGVAGVPGVGTPWRTN